MTDWAKVAGDYFRNYSDGRYDPLSQLDFIYPQAEAHASKDGQAFCIGRPGVDGLEFAYRADQPGIWVHYPMEDEWRQVADSIAALEQGWLSEAIKV